ncbi:MAG: hypothetical protein GY856_54990, partial [bacterium]|nr:hypothetical protein [bacterium]
DSYEWLVAPGEQPGEEEFAAVWSGLLDEDGVVEYAWANPGLADGVYTIRLTITDQLGRVGDARIVFTIDTTPPQVEITAPTPGTQIVGPTTVLGQVDDASLLSWSLDLIPDGGTPLVPPLAAGTQAITGTLAEWQLMPDNGPYELRLWAIDRAGHESTAAVDLTVVAAVPGPPQSLQATVGNLRDVLLSWQAGEGPAPEGYHVYRDGVRINPAPITTPGTTDLQLTEA